VILKIVPAGQEVCFKCDGQLYQGGRKVATILAVQGAINKINVVIAGFQWCVVQSLLVKFSSSQDVRKVVLVKLPIKTLNTP
jgi:glycerol-3-phosphate acyltransferase PlsY